MSSVKAFLHGENDLDLENSPQQGRWYLVQLIHRLLDFRRPDLEAVASMMGFDIAWRRPFGDDELSPYWYIRLPSEEAAVKIAERTILTRSFLEVWGEGTTLDELQASIEKCPSEIMDPWLREGQTFRVTVDAFAANLGEKERMELIKGLSFIPLKGKVDLKNPDFILALLVSGAGDQPNNGIPGDIPQRFYFGRQVALSKRSFIDTYKLTKRSYIGPTSMDAEVAFLMANQARVQKGQLVLDPYVGTGSLLVSAAVMGAQVMGADIDMRVIKGIIKGELRGRDIFSNFEQYELEGRLTGVIRMDMHLNPIRKDLEEMFHSIIADPPYGVRAGGRKSVYKDVEIRHRETHIPSTDPYTLGETLRDLLDFSARLLVVGGRLVYFFPASPDTYDPSEIPAHPALALVQNTEQFLSSRYSRRLITMEKVKRYDREEAEAYHLSKGDPILKIDRLHDFVYEEATTESLAKNDRKFRGKNF